MSIAAEITRLERKVEDCEQAYLVAANEQTGRGPAIRQEIETLRARIGALAPFAEPEPVPSGRMQDCGGCRRPFWPESLTEGRCEFCGPDSPQGRKVQGATSRKG